MAGRAHSGRHRLWGPGGPGEALCSLIKGWEALAVFSREGCNQMWALGDALGRVDTGYFEKQVAGSQASQ